MLDRALTQLQARMLITGAGTRRRMDAMGLPTGWPGTLMSTFEQWAPAALERAEALDPARVGADLLDALCARNPTGALGDLGSADRDGFLRKLCTNRKNPLDNPPSQLV